MKRRVLWVGLALLALAFGSAAQQDLTGAEWLSTIDEAERIEQSYGTFKQTMTTSTGSERTLEARSWSTDGGDVSLMVYTAPARVAGDKILLREGGGQICRHFVGSARRQKAMGSDFSYEDLASGQLTEDYTAKVLGTEELDGVECIKLECTPTESGPSYDHIQLWAGLEDHLTRRIDYFDEDGLLKTLVISDFKTIEGRTLGTKMVMTNHREGSHTTIVLDNITFDVGADRELFTKAALSRDLSEVRP
jgi:outer membrane lipoprotein-sorting protein